MLEHFIYAGFLWPCCGDPVLKSAVLKMAVRIKKKAGILTNNVVHSIPCNIGRDADAPVSKFFKPYVKQEGEGMYSKTLTKQFS